MATTQLKQSKDYLSLKALCTEIRIDPWEAREKLRIVVRDPKQYSELKRAHAPRQPWQWEKGSPSRPSPPCPGPHPN